ncbi:MAG: response regulator transcription factor [Akkermansiaceae bacterium]|nr:response regulator transcription factor [Akkermansiaceae bacterium]
MMPLMNERCILVAEDDEPIRRALTDTLEGAGYSVLPAADGREALEILLTRDVDLALLDVNMPHISGFKLLKVMAGECPGVPSIILTAHGEEQDRVKGLTLGADDYVVKPFSIAELLARIAAVLRRSPVRTKKRNAEGDLSFPGGKLSTETRHVCLDDGTEITLSDKEFDLFRYFLAHAGRVISQEELLLRVWGNNAGAARTRIVPVTLTRLKEKIGPTAAASFSNVRGRGYIWKENT